MTNGIESTRNILGIIEVPITFARIAFHRVFGSLLPVTYLQREIAAKRRAIDPEGPRSPAGARDATLKRLDVLARTLRLEVAALADYVQEAFEVELAPEDRSHEKLLEPPMSCEDRYVLYTVTRAIRPQSAVETGVANGCSSAMILAALERSGCGRLVGIDHATDDRDRLGQMIPESLRDRFTLRLGDGVAELERLVASGERIDLFVHDSNHAYRHARREYELAWRMLSPGGVLCSHDVLHSNAFDRFVSRHAGEIESTAKIVNFGIVRKKLAVSGAAPTRR